MSKWIRIFFSYHVHTFTCSINKWNNSTFFLNITSCVYVHFLYKTIGYYYYFLIFFINVCSNRELVFYYLASLEQNSKLQFESKQLTISIDCPLLVFLNNFKEYLFTKRGCSGASLEQILSTLKWGNSICHLYFMHFVYKYLRQS